jgi:hypothetical protein
LPLSAALSPTKTARADPQRAAALSPSRSGSPTRGGIARLQATVGNQGMYRLLRAGAVQTKLTVGSVDDPYEREADRIAEDVMRMPDPRTDVPVQRVPPVIQRLCAECEAEELQRKPAPPIGHAPVQISRKCPRCAEKLARGATGGDAVVQRQEDAEEEHLEEEKAIVQAKATGQSIVQRQVDRRPIGELLSEEGVIQRKRRGDGPEPLDETLERDVESLGGHGHPLPQSERQFMQSRFGYDFDAVRVHTGSRAGELAQALNARAFTLGHNVVFAPGEYRPMTAPGPRPAGTRAHACRAAGARPAADGATPTAGRGPGAVGGRKSTVADLSRSRDDPADAARAQPLQLRQQ